MVVWYACDGLDTRPGKYLRWWADRMAGSQVSRERLEDGIAPPVSLLLPALERKAYLIRGTQEMIGFGSR